MLWRLDRLLKTMHKRGFPERVDQLARGLVDLIERDPDIGIFLSVRKDSLRVMMYGLTHSLHTALLCCLLARRLGWSSSRVLRIVKAALTMNVAMLELQGRLAAQGAPALPPQMDAVLRHPQQAVERLRAAGVDDAEWLQAVAEHHERPGGGGYPEGLQDPCEMAWALQLADVFMARITPRSSRPAISLQESARHVFREDGGGPLAMAIVKELGLYPPGDVVQLRSGERAVVVRRGGSASTPIAASLTDRRGVPLANARRRDTACDEFAIVSVLPDSALAARVPPQRLYGMPA